MSDYIGPDDIGWRRAWRCWNTADGILVGPCSKVPWPGGRCELRFAHVPNPSTPLGLYAFPDLLQARWAVGKLPVVGLVDVAGAAEVGDFIQTDIEIVKGVRRRFQQVPLTLCARACRIVRLYVDPRAQLTDPGLAEIPTTMFTTSDSYPQRIVDMLAAAAATPEAPPLSELEFELWANVSSALAGVIPPWAGVAAALGCEPLPPTVAGALSPAEMVSA